MNTLNTPLTIVPPHEPPRPAVKKEFLRYIHTFRGLAIIFVVAGHLLLSWAPNSPLHYFFEVFWENGTVLFIFIAGYLFQHLSRKFEYKSYLQKKVQNVIVPYLIVSLPIIVYRLYAHDYPGYILGPHPDFAEWSVLKKLAFFIFCGGHMQQLWFVPMITLFYLAAPVLIYIDRHPSWYYLLLVTIPASLLIKREPFNDIPRMFGHFFSVYLFGMLMSRYKDRYMEIAKKQWILLTLLTIAAFVLNMVYYDQFNNALNYTHKMLFCCFFIYWLWKVDRWVPAFMGVLADLSFGIFFIHYYVILVVKAIYQRVFHHEIPGNALYWTLDLILVIAGSVAIIKTIQKLTPKYSRSIIGC
jgi:peptidoglycan/LPS O-acetylase OafA/YrhL